MSNADRRRIGLGLSIVKALVEAQGGRIAVDSTPGQGTAFHFSVPFAVPHERAVGLGIRRVGENGIDA